MGGKHHIILAISLLLFFFGGRFSGFTQSVPIQESLFLDCPVFEYSNPGGWFDRKNSEGEVLFYDPAGYLRVKGTFQNGKPNGRWTFFHPNGQIECEGRMGQTNAEPLIVEEVEEDYWGEGQFDDGFSVTEDTISWEFPPDGVDWEEDFEEPSEVYYGGMLNICTDYPGFGKVGLWKYFNEEGKIEKKVLFLE